MGLDDQFGRDSDSIKRWLAQRATYASEEVRMRVDPELRAAAEPEPIDDDPARAVRPHDAGAAVVAALTEQHDQPEHQAPPRRPPAPAVSLHAPPERPARRQTPRQREQTSEATYAARSTNLAFAPRSAIRRFLTILVLVMVAATAAAGYVAYREPTSTTIGVAVAIGVLALVVWGARAAAVPTVLLLKHGRLQVVRGGITEVADVANPRTPIAVVGKPGSPRWRVLIERPDAPLLVIDPSMVDPEAFTEVLYQVHPRLWCDSGAVFEPWQLR